MLKNEVIAFVKTVQPESWLKGILYSLMIIVIYHSALGWMILSDWSREDYSYAYLIPIVLLYLLWEKREVLAHQPSVPSWKGLLPLIIGVLFFWLGKLGGELYTQYMSLWFVSAGILWLHLGWRKLKTIGFALVMMLAMFPFPHFINDKITFGLKLVSSQIGVWMLHLYGMSAYREGNVIDLGFTQLQVVDACSGLRYLFPLMVLSLILAYWFKARFWKKAVLFLSSIPVAIFVNSFRIALTGVLYSFWGPAVAEGFFHGFSGWLIFLFTTGIMLVEMWILTKIGKDEQIASRICGDESSTAQLTEETVSRGRSLLQPQFLVAGVILGLTLGLSQGVEFQGKIPIKQSLTQFPLQIGEWSGSRNIMDQQYVDVLDLSDYVIINYKNPQKQPVNFYTAYYENQQTGESIHSPDTCLPGSGWKFSQAEEVVIKAKNGKSMRVNRVLMEKDGEKQLAYYWFPMRGRVLTKLYQLKLYNFWDALTRQRTDGALVRVITPIANSESPADADMRIRNFLNEAVPLLPAFIPD
ncbi:MAG: VPLPA-CTERM-specific exosortase XrtD [Syntrophus sp. (in: bacteria)]|nr:VPLPA-CTERM-specific exosortase XrtD [Syntrophus sp. (in: bacteria)]